MPKSCGAAGVGYGWEMHKSTMVARCAPGCEKGQTWAIQIAVFDIWLIMEDIETNNDHFWLLSITFKNDIAVCAQVLNKIMTTQTCLITFRSFAALLVNIFSISSITWWVALLPPGLPHAMICISQLKNGFVLRHESCMSCKCRHRAISGIELSCGDTIEGPSPPPLPNALLQKS